MSEDAHPALTLDDTVHQRVRLGIMAVLSEVAECTFTTLRDTLGLSDGNLAQHVRVLEDADLIAVQKGYQGRKPCTWLRLTPTGTTALRDEVAALERIVARIKTK
jgi:DNA-binding MarR family transcriptional regulator